MTMTSRRRHRVRAAATVATAVAVLVAGSATATTAAPQPKYPMVLVGTTSAAYADRYAGDEFVAVRLGTHVIAGDSPFEIRVKRHSYGKPPVAYQVVRSGGKAKEVRLPDGLVTDFSALKKFFHLTVKDAAGKTVVDRDEDFCPNNDVSARTRRDAPDSTPYPMSCGQDNPFVLGAVWGIQAGWNAPTFPEDFLVKLADGKHTATVTVNKRYRDLFGIPANRSSATVALTVRTLPEPDPDPTPAPTAGKKDAPHHGARTDVLQPAARRPVVSATIPTGPRPDLRSLPAWSVSLTKDDGEDQRAAGRDYLSFAATVWNAGTSPLVVDGFRRTGKDLMDAYQYFYDAKGKQVGSAAAGTMEWDARDGHTHWHFTDFARYRLLDKDKKNVVKSGKEAFCLANTDDVDYTLPNAKWRPGNTDLASACGVDTSVAVRQVLDVGSGDTYAQSLPGQSFDVTDVPNGTYYIEVAANPANRLKESNTANNTSLRQVILGGKPGARTLKVPAYQGING
jgi:hypothetical protein